MGRKIKSLYMGDGCEEVEASLEDIKARYERRVEKGEYSGAVLKDLIRDLFKALDNSVETTGLSGCDVLICPDCGANGNVEMDYDCLPDQTGGSDWICNDCDCAYSAFEEITRIVVTSRGKPSVCCECGGQVEVTDKEVRCLEPDCKYIHERWQDNG